jgi:hypothetical protein
MKPAILLGQAARAAAPPVARLAQARVSAPAPSPIAAPAPPPLPTVEIIRGDKRAQEVVH